MNEVTWSVDGTRITVRLPASEAGWAAGGTPGLSRIPATHAGRGDEPAPIPAPTGSGVTAWAALACGM